MKIDEILIESKQLEEGPLGSTIKAVGRGIGKTIGGVAKAAGAVSGAVQGAKTAFQTGKQAAADVVGGTAQPAQTAPTTAQINQQGPKGTAIAKQQSGKAAQALKQTAQAMAGNSPEQVGQTLYAQVKSQVNQLDKKGKQRILQLLQKSLQQAAPAAQPAAAAPAATKPIRGKPINVAGASAQPAAQPQQQVASIQRKEPSLVEGRQFSLYRTK